MTAMRIFISSAHNDAAFVRMLANALRDAGADVWFSEQNLAAGQFMGVIERELKERHVFIVVLSPSALQSHWVEREIQAAYMLTHRDPSRVILPVVAVPFERADIPLFLETFKRIEAPGGKPYPPEEAIQQVLRALALTPSAPVPTASHDILEEAFVPMAPIGNERAGELLTRASALRAQGRAAEALSFVIRASQLAPQWYDAWDVLGGVLLELGQPVEALAAFERAVKLASAEASAWRGRADALRDLHRYEEARVTYERALELAPDDVFCWRGKASALYALARYAEALAAYDRALELDPTSASSWDGKADALNALKRFGEAIDAYERAIAIDPTRTASLTRLALAYNNMHNFHDALAMLDRALHIEPESVDLLSLKASMLIDQLQFAAALEALDGALRFAPDSVILRKEQLRVLRILKRSDRIVDSCDDALRLDSAQTDIWATKGLALWSLRRYADAADSLRRALESDPTSVGDMAKPVRTLIRRFG